MFAIISLLVIVVNINKIKTSAEEVIIESISTEETNLWDKRPLIQCTTYKDEYLGAVRLGAFTMPEFVEEKEEKLYEEASKCVVRIVMGQYAGSGLIWCIEQEGMVIVANKHLLREAAHGTVTFVNEMSLQAEILTFAQEYDLGFLFIPREELTSELLRDCYEVRKVQGLPEQAENQKIIQIGSSQSVAADCYEGVINGTNFVPEFQAFMLETTCYSKAGMSGGGVFDEKGHLFGMIAGGNVDIDDSIREAQITYSIPAWQIEEEYMQYKMID